MMSLSITISSVSYTRPAGAQEDFFILLSGSVFVHNTTRRRASPILSCQAGEQWRLTRAGGPDSTACTCPATGRTNCMPQVTCAVVPRSGETWLVRAFPANLCATPAPSGENKQDQLALGLGLGLGLGLPALGLVGAAVYLKNRPDRPSMLIDDNCPPADEPGRTGLVVVHARSGETGQRVQAADLFEGST